MTKRKGPPSATPLDQLARLFSSPAAIALFRTVTGHADIDFADAQATAYHAGDFLTAHDDNVAGKGPAGSLCA